MFPGCSCVAGKELKFDSLKGKVCLVTNVACQCGLTNSNYKVGLTLAVPGSEASLLHLVTLDSPYPNHVCVTVGISKDSIMASWHLAGGKACKLRLSYIPSSPALSSLLPVSSCMLYWKHPALLHLSASCFHSTLTIQQLM
jgi:hypothetical protein